jgi:hypothetical protein
VYGTQVISPHHTVLKSPPCLCTQVFADLIPQALAPVEKRLEENTDRIKDAFSELRQQHIASERRFKEVVFFAAIDSQLLYAAPSHLVCTSGGDRQ